jgi:drug/metabolite transporter (DMT)-like permease
MSRRSATLVGFSAILMWGLLALLSKLAGNVPPLQITSMAFLVGGLIGVASWPFRKHAVTTLTSQAWQVWALNIGGLFGCHLLYFMAVQNAPIVEVSLVAYTWPLLIVVFSAFLPGETLRLHHLLGVAMGLAGAFLVITKGEGFSLADGLQLGHMIALPYAVLWAGFSVSIRRYGKIPSDIVAGFCLACALLAALFHFALEPTAWPIAPQQMLAIAGLGLLPMGAAFYAWDFGMKHGDTMILGAAAYAAPLLSTLALLAAGMATFHWSIGLACILITAGAIVASIDLLRRNAST